LTEITLHIPKWHKAKLSSNFAVIRHYLLCHYVMLSSEQLLPNLLKTSESQAL